jgi:hypothetical protein
MIPIGLQIAGPPWEEQRRLELALTYQDATDWHTRRPPAIPSACPLPDGTTKSFCVRISIRAPVSDAEKQTVTTVNFESTAEVRANGRQLTGHRQESAKSGHCDDLPSYSKAAVPPHAESTDFAMLGGSVDRNRVAIRRKN